MTLICCPNTSQDSGFSFGGSAIVRHSHDVYEAFEMVQPLDEIANGTAGEYQDRTRHELDGTGGDGANLETVPTQDEGVFCLPSQHFDGRQYITLETDGLIPAQDFAVSLWAKIETQFAPRTFYARGCFYFGYDFLNRADAIIHYRLSDVATDDDFVTGSTQLSQNTWYHLAASWEPDVGLKVYVNGVLNGSKAIAYDTVLAQSDCALSLTDNGDGYVEGNQQEVRLHPTKRSAAWFLAEYENLCDASNFYSIGEEGQYLTP